MFEVIIVGVNYVREKCFQEYFFEKFVACFDSLFEVWVGGIVFFDVYLKFFIQELKFYVDCIYCIKFGKGYIYIGGLSMGGLVFMYVVCEYLEVFVGVFCLFMYWLVFLQDDILEVVQAIIDYFVVYLLKGKCWYFDYGIEGLD